MVCHCLLQPGNLVFLLRPRGDLQLSAVTEDGQLRSKPDSDFQKLARLCSAMPDNLLICTFSSC